MKHTLCYWGGHISRGKFIQNVYGPPTLSPQHISDRSSSFLKNPFQCPVIQPSQCFPAFHLFKNGQMSGRLQSFRSTFAKYGNTTQMEIGRFDRN